MLDVSGNILENFIAEGFSCSIHKLQVFLVVDILNAANVELARHTVVAHFENVFAAANAGVAGTVLD